MTKILNLNRWDEIELIPQHNRIRLTRKEVVQPPTPSSNSKSHLIAASHEFETTEDFNVFVAQADHGRTFIKSNFKS